MDSLFFYSALFFSFLMVISLYRAVLGPTVLDRLVGVNAIGSKTTALLILIGLIYHRVEMFVDIGSGSGTRDRRLQAAFIRRAPESARRMPGAASYDRGETG